MAETLRLLRVFLASPSDLAAERLAARDAVKEINELVARPAGYQVDLIGWEDTIAEARRAQAVINDDLDQCDIFVGMLYAKWGTPPDKHGIFTSGFEEEYVRSRERRERTGSPDMKMYFKTVDDARIKDAGPELQKVLEFKAKLISEKEVYFQPFDSPQDIARILRASVAAHIQKLIGAETLASNEELSQAPLADSQENRQPRAATILEDHPDSDFLINVSSKIDRDDEFTPAEVARVRLIGASLHIWGNSDADLGIHDANILYAEYDHGSFSWRELVSLLNQALSRFSQQISPLWQWLSRTEKEHSRILVYKTITGEDRVRVGALQVLEILRREILDDEFISRDWVIEQWFNKSSRSPVKNSALRYLKSVGVLSDLSVIEGEISLANSETIKIATEAAISILLRFKAEDAARFILQSSFETLDPELLSQGLAHVRALSAEELEVGLSHRSPAVRAAVLARMGQMTQIDQDALQRATSDDSPVVRMAALSILDKADSMSIASMTSILSKPKRTGNYLFLGSGVDEEAAEFLLEVKRRRFLKAGVDSVEVVANGDSQDRDVAWLVCADRAFPARSQELRSNLDDRFRAFVASRWPEDRGAISQGLLSLGITPEERRRRSLIRSALDVLLKRRADEDLLRVRGLIDEEAMPFALSDILYLQEIGGWDDISRLARIGSKKTGGLLADEGSGLEHASVTSILRIAKGRELELTSMGLPGNVLAAIIASVADRAFSKWPDTIVDPLLLHEDDAVRRATALKMAKAFPKKRSRAALARYLASEGQRYYNVVFWLDLVEAFPSSEARSIAASAINRDFPS